MNTEDIYILTMRRADAETSVPSDWENSLPTWDPNPATTHAPVELSYLGKLESMCPSFDCQQPNLIGSVPTKVAAVNHHQIIRDYIYKCEP